MLDIPEGAYGKTRAGDKVGPVKRRSCSKTTDKREFYYEAKGGFSWYSHGRCIDNGTEKPGDLIAEWTDGPVRTVTRREVVAGSYGRVSVGGVHEGRVVVSMGGFGMVMQQQTFSADELKAAAAVLLELAGALE